MIQRRALADLLIEIADGFYDVTAPVGLRATAMQVALPVDLEMAHTSIGPEFRVELPRFVTHTSFDRRPDRLTIRWAEAITP